MVLDRVVNRALDRFTGLDTLDLHGLLNLDKGYHVARMSVSEGSWLDGRNLRRLALADEGILVLNIQRTSGFVLSTPAARTYLRAGDQVLLYGREGMVPLLQERPAGPEGDEAHLKAAQAERQRAAGEASEDDAAGHA